MSYNRIKSTSTIQDLIRVGKNLYNAADALHFKETIINDDNETVVFNIYSIMDRYMDELESIIQTIELSDTEYLDYRFQPKRLCVDVYNCADLAPLILKINNMTSILEFDSKTIRLFNTSILKILNEIKILEKERIDSNNSDINKKINRTK